MSLKTAWLNLQDSLGNRFAWSHVNAVYYNWAQKKLLKEKLDDIDTAINAKVAKTDIVQVESTATDKVPSCAYIKNIKDELDGDIAELNSKQPTWFGKEFAHNLQITAHQWADVSTGISIPQDKTYDMAYVPYTGNASVFAFNAYVSADREVRAQLSNLSDQDVTLGFASVRVCYH